MKKRNVLLSMVMAASLFACAQQQEEPVSEEPAEQSREEAASEEPVTSEKEEKAEKNGEIYILATSDVHCAIDQGFGYAGLKRIRDTLEEQGYTTILIDNGDSIQGEAIGTISRGEALIDLMNAMEYDVAIPGNHEFDYGMERFLEMTEKAEFPYICCNFVHDEKLVFKPYFIKEASGKKIAFVGITTPKTLTSSTPAYFQNENGEFIYGFMRDDTGEKVYEAVQNAVDEARAEGAEYVYAMGHIGMEANCHPWTYADIISHTNGIDVFFDGHSHDSQQVVMKNKDGEDVLRCALGTKLNSIGYSHITEDGIVETDVWSWPNSVCAQELLGIQNDITDQIDAAKEELAKQMNVVVAKTEVELTVNDPVLKDDNGNPVRIVRRAETNLADLCADAFRQQGDAEIGMVNGGGVRKSIPVGDITYKDIIDVLPFGNYMTVAEASGQQILDALEWGVRFTPQQSGSFLQVSGLSFEVDLSVPSGCQYDDMGMFSGIEGERRIKNVKVNGEDIVPDQKYTLASTDYILTQNGDGYTMFDGATILQDAVKLDNQVLIDFITEYLGGVIAEEYENPYGQGRINILNGE